MRTWVLAAMMVVTAHGALAADMPDLPVLRGFVNDGPRPTRTVWEGFYVGGQGAFSSAESNLTNVNNPLVSDFAANNSLLWSSPPLRFPFPGFPPLGRAQVSGASFGGFVGYNAQWDDAIISIEGNYSRTKLKSSFGGREQVGQHHHIWRLSLSERLDLAGRPYRERPCHASHARRLGSRMFHALRICGTGAWRQRLGASCYRASREDRCRSERTRSQRFPWHPIDCPDPEFDEPADVRIYVRRRHRGHVVKQCLCARRIRIRAPRSPDRCQHQYDSRRPGLQILRVAGTRPFCDVVARPLTPCALTDELSRRPTWSERCRSTATAIPATA